jgi:CubicO group peptidase (beta-lactamase class C family)
MRLTFTLIGVLTLLSGNAAAQALNTQSFRGAADMDAVIEQAVREDKIPGAVVLVGHEGQIVYRKAYGNRALAPSREPMTVDTIFDIASLTKIVATTSGMMKLFEEGRVRISDPVTEYLPEFQGGHSAITIRDLMTHFSGLRPDLDLEPAWTGYETGIQKALVDKPAGPPAVKFVYSDINFILLGDSPLERHAGKRVCEEDSLRSAGHDRYRLSACARVEASHRADGDAKRRRDSSRHSA